MGGIFLLRETHLENLMSRPNVIPTFRQRRCTNREKYSTGTKYQKADRTYYTDEWAKIKGEWYYFGSDSYMKTGWIQLAGTWFYLENDGKMSTGWEQINNVWYYFNNSGAMQTGWVQTKPGYWYYLNSDGAMLCNTVVEGHQLNADGLMIN